MDEDGDEDAGPEFGVLSSDEVERCMYIIKDLQHRAIFRLIVDTGMSLDEIIGNEELGTPGIFVPDINAREMTIKLTYRFRADDRFSVRVIPISAATLAVLKDWLISLNRDFQDGQKVFRVGKRRVRQFFGELNELVEFEHKVTVYTLRRTAMVNMLKAGLKPNEVRRRMGFIRDREERLLGAISYILMDEQHYENMIRAAVIDSVAQPIRMFEAASGALASCGQPPLTR